MIYHSIFSIGIGFLITKLTENSVGTPLAVAVEYPSMRIFIYMDL